jgi:hypothetical protein
VSQKVFDVEDFRELDNAVLEAFQEFGHSTLTLRRYKPGLAGTVLDQDFRYYTAEVEDTFQLHYTQFEYSSIKQLGPERADFAVMPIYYVWIPSREVRDLLPNGRIYREQDLIVLNGFVYQIDNVIQIGAYHGKSLMNRLHLVYRGGDEENQ